MQIVDLFQVLGAVATIKRLGCIFWLVADLPLSPHPPGRNTKTLRGAQKVVERVGRPNHTLDMAISMLTNEGVSRAQRPC
jgi:hypothetical protein